MDNPKSLNWHINIDGLSENVLSDLMSHFVNLQMYKGIFPYNHIQLKKTEKFCIIVNVGFHFVAICVCETFVLYIDPLGNPVPFLPELILFLKNLKKPIFFNCKQIQSNKSSHCGFFSCLFCIYFEYIFTNQHPQINLSFHKKQLTKNDKLCISYINELYKIM